MDYYGRILNIAGKSLGAGDEYAKTLLYKAQIKALAARSGVAKGLKGDELKQFVAELAENPTDIMRSDALDFAKYGTFTKELGQTGQNIQWIISRNPALRFAIPFFRTPTNIFKFTFERTPLAFASRQIREDIKAGGVRGAMAKAKIGMGSSVMMLGVDLSMNGHITGGGPATSKEKANLRRLGWQPYSIKIGDTYYSYSRFEPVATVLGMAADYAEILSNYESYDIEQQERIDNLAAAMTVAVSNQVVGKTFMSGIADITEVLSDPKRYSSHFVNRYAGSLIPSGVAAIERAGDPQMEYVFNMMDAVKARIPGMSEDVPKRLNIWGEEIKAFYPSDDGLLSSRGERIASIFNPIYTSKAKPSPIDRFMLQNGFNISMPDKIQKIEDVAIDLKDYPEIYHRFVQLRGKDIKLPKYLGNNMKDFLDKLVAGKIPQSIAFFGPFKDPADQQNYISQVASDYTKSAKGQLMAEYPVLSQIILEVRLSSKERELTSKINKPIP